MPPLADPDTPVAVVGAGCVLPPTSTSLRAYRRNLLEGTSGISPIPRDRWDREHYHSDDRFWSAVERQQPVADQSSDQQPIQAVAVLALYSVVQLR